MTVCRTETHMVNGEYPQKTRKESGCRGGGDMHAYHYNEILVHPTMSPTLPLAMFSQLPYYQFTLRCRSYPSVSCIRKFLPTWTLSRKHEADLPYKCFECPVYFLLARITPTSTFFTQV